MNILNAVFAFYGFQIIAIIVIALLSWFIFDKRLRKKHGTVVQEGFHRTEEVMIDPVDGKKHRVFYNENTGERFYKEEK